MKRFIQIFVLMAPLFLTGISSIVAQTTGARVETEFSGQGWKLWLDDKAEWKNDPLFVPPVDPSRLPVNPPTCGWGQLFAKSLPQSQAAQVLADKTLSLDVQVPGTVEEFCWDALSGNKNGLGNSGNYVGVSWWGQGLYRSCNCQGQTCEAGFFRRDTATCRGFCEPEIIGL